MRKQLLKIMQEAQADIKELECIVQPAGNANDSDGKIQFQGGYIEARCHIVE